MNIEVEKNTNKVSNHSDLYPYGQCYALRPDIGVVLAPNPKDYTGPGTNTYLVGDDEQVWIIDPGPDESAHIDAVMREVEHRRVLGILVTHSHLDHSPAARPLSMSTSAPVYGFSPLDPALAEQTEEDIDLGYAPDVVLEDGARIGDGALQLTAHHTPGHFPNHLCYRLEMSKIVFSGDHVMDWSTTVVVPPLGHLGDYLDSLKKLQGLGASKMLPSHGGVVEDPHARIESIFEHRRSRHEQILACLDNGLVNPEEIVDEIYDGLTPRLVKAAKGQVNAHLDILNQEVSIFRKAS